MGVGRGEEREREREREKRETRNERRQTRDLHRQAVCSWVCWWVLSLACVVFEMSASGNCVIAVARSAGPVPVRVLPMAGAAVAD
jgi:hypothetical protein